MPFQDEVGVHVLVADRYRLEDALGQGTMGEVWRATDQLLGRPVAVKLLRTDTAEAEGPDRFRREAQIAARLNHPHVVAVYDFGNHGAWHYLVMELVDGWTLRQELYTHGVLDPHHAAALAAQVAEGLSAAHREGVIHRDIKPANVMVTTERTVKITDFGIARLTDDATSTLTASGKILGTGDYLAPERALGRPAAPASDVYSLGCMLYQLLTGRPPFLGSTTLDVVQQQVSGAPVPPTQLRPDIPAPLADCVMELLAKNPTHRPNAEQTADRLGQLHRSREDHAGMAVPPAMALASQPSPGRPSRARTRRFRKRDKTLLGAGAVVLFSGTAALGATLNTSDNVPYLPVTHTLPPTSAPASTAPRSDASHATPSSAQSPTTPY